MRSLLVAQPFLQADTSELRQAAASLTAVPAGGGGSGGAEGRVLEAVRHHRLGLLADARGERGALARERSALSGLAAEPDVRPLATALAASLAAREAHRDGRLEDALRALDVATLRPSRASVAATEVGDRFLRAEILHRLGRDDEALGWYASMAERASYELPWLAPSQLRLAQIYDARGQTGLARRHYLRFLTLWQDCDPPLRSTTAEAARAVARLGTQAGGH
jgi:tetratricopeptide (TPR) repeat protein